jgi:UDP-GlcNAc:undecaprenyl-phosphate GlcNAc-1-phosphate transferase
VPILDTVFAIVRRASKRQALDVADKGHLHHRLMNLGHGHRRSVMILWTWTALLSGFVLYPVLTDDNPRYLPFGIGALGIVLFTVLHPSVRRKRAMEVEAALERPASEQVDPSRPERREAESGGPARGSRTPAGGADTEESDIPVQQELPLDADLD